MRIRSFSNALYALTVILTLSTTTACTACSSGDENNKLDNPPSSIPHLGNVNRFQRTFHALNDVHLASAHRLGVSPITDRKEAEELSSKLKNIEHGDDYVIQKLTYSIPYLVQPAKELLCDIAQTFRDSLKSKGYTDHKVTVTSVLRTEADVKRLRRRNINASAKSCHRFGTTFDISWKRFKKVDTSWFAAKRKKASIPILKQVLAQVLRDKQLEQRCYVKYEVKQACFHITVRN